MTIIHVGEVIEFEAIENEIEELYGLHRTKSLRKSTSIDVCIPETYDSDEIKNVLMSSGMAEDLIEDILHSFRHHITVGSFSVNKSVIDITPILEVPGQERPSNEKDDEKISKSPQKKKQWYFIIKEFVKRIKKVSLQIYKDK